MKYCLLLIFLSTQLGLIAQTDSLAFKSQRNRINLLLDERSNRFDQYENSLQSRTGVFGLKTKKDLQRSNDILREIIMDDNQVFKELKVLMDLKEYEKQVVESRAENVESRINNFQTTIRKLQQQNEKIQVDLEKAEKKLSFQYLISLILFAGLSLSVFYSFRGKKLRSPDKD